MWAACKKFEVTNWKFSRDVNELGSFLVKAISFQGTRKLTIMSNFRKWIIYLYFLSFSARVVSRVQLINCFESALRKKYEIS